MSTTTTQAEASGVNLAATIIPKSDQLNADDLISGPRTLVITKVCAGTTEQPVSIHYEGDAGRPYKPGKSMRRVLAVLWGLKANVYIGRRITLYRDPEIKFGGDVVGGIRISHASHISEPVSLVLTVTRGKRKPFVVQPLPEEQAFDIQALTDVGETKARAGTAALQAWWATVPAAAKKALKAKLDGEWKTLAAEAA
jgi:hypothetical protein